MRLGKELVGKPIFSITNGQELGSLRDLYLDTEQRAINGIYLGSEGIFSRKAKVIVREDIRVLGIDALLAVGPDVMTDSGESPDVKSWFRREEIQGREVQTPGGTKVGTIGDILIDDEGTVVGFWLARVNVEGPISENKMLFREAVVDTGGAEGIMKVDLARAEAQIMDPAEGAALDIRLGEEDAEQSAAVESTEEPSSDEPSSEDVGPTEDA